MFNPKINELVWAKIGQCWYVAPYAGFFDGYHQVDMPSLYSNEIGGINTEKVLPFTGAIPE